MMMSSKKPVFILRDPYEVVFEEPAIFFYCERNIKPVLHPTFGLSGRVIPLTKIQLCHLQSLKILIKMTRGIQVIQIKPHLKNIKYKWSRTDSLVKSLLI